MKGTEAQGLPAVRLRGAAGHGPAAALGEALAHTRRPRWARKRPHTHLCLSPQPRPRCSSLDSPAWAGHRSRRAEPHLSQDGLSSRQGRLGMASSEYQLSPHLQNGDFENKWPRDNQAGILKKRQMLAPTHTRLQSSLARDWAQDRGYPAGYSRAWLLEIPLHCLVCVPGRAEPATQKTKPGRRLTSWQV